VGNRGGGCVRTRVEGYVDPREMEIVAEQASDSCSSHSGHIYYDDGMKDKIDIQHACEKVGGGGALWECTGKK
jgi:peptide methionine sulfoxide reductase MsrB